MNQYLKNLQKIEFVVTYACTGRCRHCSEGDHTNCGERIDPVIAADAVRKIAAKYDVKTRDDSNADDHRYPYEPTPYKVLLRLATSCYFSEKDTVLDYGCGKGRVGFFLAPHTKAKYIGIEYDELIYQAALKNHRPGIFKQQISFRLSRAEEYEVPSEVNRCYFFNPFSIEILRKVMARILESYYEDPRQILLFFYYPSDEYMCYLMTLDELEFYDEIDCGDIFENGDKRERIMVFELPYYEAEE